MTGPGSEGAHSLQGREVLVVGASSQVGWFLLPRLLSAGARVTALSRKPAPGAWSDFDGLAWLTPQELSGDRFTHLVSAGPLPLAVELAARMPRLRAMSLTSSSSVMVKAASPVAAERTVIDQLLAAEQGAMNMAAQRRLSLVLLRPTLLYGCGMDRNVSAMASFIRRFRCLPIATRSGGLRQPLHVDDLAAGLVTGLQRSTGLPLFGPLCGGETMDYRSMARRVFQALSMPPRFIDLPPALLATALTAAGRLGLLPGANGEMVHRQAINLVFDDAQLRRELALQPRRFSPTASDFELPTRRRLERLSGRD